MTNDTFDALKQQYHAGTITLADSNRLVDELILRSDRQDSQKIRKCIMQAGELAVAVNKIVAEISE